jgi:barbiturase
MTVTSAHKVVLGSVSDTTELEKLIAAGAIDADTVVAVIGKTEGNGGVNDFTRILADQAFRRTLLTWGNRTKEEVAAIPMVWSGGCDGVLCPHATVFSRSGGGQGRDGGGQGGDGASRGEDGGSRGDSGGSGNGGRESGSRGDSGGSGNGARESGSGGGREGEVSRAVVGRLVVGAALSDPILPEDIGRGAMVAKVAAAVRSAMDDAGIVEVGDVHWVQTKTPLLTVTAIAEAASRGQDVVNDDVHRSMDLSNGTTALGVALALGEIADMPPDDAICRDLSLYSSVASCSSGVELDRAQIVVVGNSIQAGGEYRAGHSVMVDALDASGIYRAIADAGLPLPDRPVAADLGTALVNVFMKCEADPRATLRGRRQIMLDDSDVHHHRQIKAAVGGVAAAAVGDPAVFVSVGALHQGPPGGGPVMAIVRVIDPEAPAA